jgi:hypothetical protein
LPPREGERALVGVARDAALWALALVLTSLIVLIPLSLMLAIGALLFEVFDWAPLNWVGHLIVFGGVVALFDVVASVKQNHDDLVLPPHEPLEAEPRKEAS